MKALMFAALVAIRLVLAFGGTGGDNAQRDPAWKQGMQRVRLVPADRPLAGNERPDPRAGACVRGLAVPTGEAGD